MISVFEYTNYRAYLQDYYAWAKSHLRGFSHRAFLTKAGMSGPNYLKRVMEGVHKLTDNSIPKFSNALDHSEKEARYFKNLVYFNQAKTLDEKDKYFEQLMELKSPHVQHLLERDQYNYYGDWINIAIREILSYFPYNNNPSDLGREISPPQPAKKVKKAIELLANLKLIEETPEGGYVLTSRALTTGPEVQSLLIPKFHLAMSKLGLEAVTRYKKNERHVSSVTMSLSEEGYRDLVKLVEAFRKKVTQRVAEETRPDRAYHMNIQLFPVSRIKPGRRKFK